MLALKRVSGGTQQQPRRRSCRISSRRPPNLTLTLSARVDHWRNYDGHNLETNRDPTGTPTVNNKPAFPSAPTRSVSPRVAARYHLSERVSVWGASSSGFRAPTLNELYRQFRVGTVLTLATISSAPSG